MTSGAAHPALPKVELSIVVVHHRTPEQLRQCLEALHGDATQPATPHRAELVIVDNSLRPELRQLFDQLRDTSDSRLSIEVVELERNDGFGAACNDGIRRTAADRLLLLNPDVRLSLTDAFELSARLDADERRAAVGCKLLAPDGCAEPTWSPPLRFWSEVERRRFWQAWEARERWAVERAERMQGRARTVPWLTAACLALHRQAFEQVGGFDERYFLYYEDIDLGEALRDRGYELFYTPEITARHERGSSTREREGMPEVRRASRRIFYRKWGSLFDRVALRLLDLLRRPSD